MATLWNRLVLAEPPMCCTLVSITKETTEGLSLLKDILQQCLSQLSDESHLLSEIIVLSSLIYKKNSQLRRDKSMQGLKQILRCLTRYSAANIHEIAVKLFEGFGSFGSMTKENVFIPSQQTMQHFLVKLIGVTCLLSQTVNYAVHTFLLLRQRLCRGHLTSTNLVFMCTVSRLWAICKSQALVYMSLYNRLLPVIHVLTPTEVPWLPDNDTLPADLGEYVHSVTGVHLGTRQQEHDLSRIFERIEKEYGVESEKGEGHIEVDEGHESAPILDIDENVTDVHNSMEDIGVPVKPKAVKCKQNIVDLTKPLSYKTAQYMDTKDWLSCVKKACTFGELKSILLTLVTSMSPELKIDWKNSMLTVKELKTKSKTSENSGGKSIVQLLKKAKSSVRLIVNKYFKLKESSTEKNDSPSVHNETNELKSVQTEKAYGVIDRSSSSKLDTKNKNLKLKESSAEKNDNQSFKDETNELTSVQTGKAYGVIDRSSSSKRETVSENKVKRKDLKKVIKMLREKDQFELDGKSVHLGSVECKKLQKSLKLVLKRLKRTENDNVQKEADLLNEGRSLLVNTATLQLKTKNIIHQSEIVSNMGDNKERKLHMQLTEKKKETDNNYLLLSVDVKNKMKRKTKKKEKLLTQITENLKEDNNDVLLSEVVKNKRKRTASENKDDKLLTQIIKSPKENSNNKNVKNKKKRKVSKNKEDKLHMQLTETQKEENNNDVLSSNDVKNKRESKPLKNQDGKLHMQLTETKKEEISSEVHSSNDVKNKRKRNPTENIKKIHTQLREKPKDMIPVIKTNIPKKRYRTRQKEKKNVN